MAVVEFMLFFSFMFNTIEWVTKRPSGFWKPCCNSSRSSLAKLVVPWNDYGRTAN